MRKLFGAIFGVNPEILKKSSTVPDENKISPVKSYQRPEVTLIFGHGTYNESGVRIQNMFKSELLIRKS